ncbi:UDP-N-acetylmuramoyl-tripeptide--D-alanyl-D-alanine ligase [Candidatus Daviesbacteria bacterium]|nr:UDP-N-acetylmuramoyl-tripeptide--D-alanyl-D-alanine ligase [Candidatus Daviesbacteria bacterium]
MLNISAHPIWKNINPIKRQAHKLRIFLSRNYASLYPRSMFIGISGSVGKTTTTIACKTVLSEKMNVIATTDTLKKTINLDPIFNLPMTILRIKPGVKKVILEMGIEYPGEMELWLTFVKPATAIITRIFYAHSEYLGGLEQIALEKGKLVEQLPKEGLAILNWDDPIARKLADKTKAKVIYFGTDKDNCHIWADKIKISNFQTQFEINYGVERVEIRSKLLGVHQVYPLLAAAALGICNGIPLVRVKIGLEKIPSPQHRMEVLEGFNGSVILDDTYNGAPIAIEEAIETLNYLPARRRIVVLGEMRELGIYSEKLHRQIAQKIYKDKVDLVFLGTGDTKFIYEELINLGFNPDRIQTDLQNPQLVNKLLKVLAKGDLVLVKGARAVRLDEVVKRITKLKKN